MLRFLRNSINQEDTVPRRRAEPLQKGLFRNQQIALKYRGLEHRNNFQRKTPALLILLQKRIANLQPESPIDRRRIAHRRDNIRSPIDIQQMPGVFGGFCCARQDLLKGKSPPLGQGRGVHTQQTGLSCPIKIQTAGRLAFLQTKSNRSFQTEQRPRTIRIISDSRFLEIFENRQAAFSQQNKSAGSIAAVQNICRQ